MKYSNVIIIGSGIAALQLARKLRDDLNVMIITKSSQLNSNSYLAQGGIAAAIGMNDHPEKHFIDTLEAGRYHNHPGVVRALTEAAPNLISDLVHHGCVFDKDEYGELALGMEGAHSEKRIIHGGGDATGKTIIDFMVAQNNNIKTIENVYVFELLLDSAGERCIGVKGKMPDGKIETYFADHIVLATGGCGQLYRYTSNAEPVIGDGIALAYQAGAEISDMEFIQFHPTLLYVNGKTRGLISEAVRGEGGRLVTEEGKLIMEHVHPLADLAPRHIVSQTIYDYLKRGKQIFLDISNVKYFSKRFPTIASNCKNNGIDLKKNKIPVVPGSHFLMGGIKTDLFGRSSLKGLYAIGEVACTGVHGANRLASNSLLEGLFFGQMLAEHLNKQSKEKINFDVFSRKKATVQKNLPSIQDIQHLMMERVGIVRSQEGLLRQKQWLKSFSIENVDLAELPHENISQVFMLITASLITDAALERTESRGGHFRQDYPCENDHLWLRKEINLKGDGAREQIEATAVT
ncbi:L-aspartate oxidase [Bacillus sp. FJAT-50079]|uniref:L-aspartate oxidase n=1 Tax=Bacillus sp. FJAT-50079 TaxID=2833577 RepID=UPI001BCA07AC|nr:L-aspartate oxidase [Bacillus sp. FJAT-50079]MBS4210277.1 L-aspartate oxidase [Bacillus sp. FJAT-50079]